MDVLGGIGKGERRRDRRPGWEKEGLHDLISPFASLARRAKDPRWEQGRGGLAAWEVAGGPQRTPASTDLLVLQGTRRGDWRCRSTLGHLPCVRDWR